MKHIGTQPVETPRLWLRRFVPGDAEAMFATWAQDEAVTRHMTWDPHAQVDETRAVLQNWLAAYDQPDYYHWAITLQPGGTLIGSLGILRMAYSENDTLCFHPGYCIGQAYWGQGYVTEALQAALGFFIGATGDTDLACAHAVAIPASGRVLEKCGFVYNHNGFYRRMNGQEIPARHYVFDPVRFRPLAKAEA